MKKGTFKPGPADKGKHWQNFGKALDDALDKWQPSDGEEVEVELKASISQNPGSIKEYIAILR
jgi:hypothetical protein